MRVLHTTTRSIHSVKGTVEDRISQLQEKKRKMVQAAFGESKFLSRAARLTYEDLKYLFG